MNKDKVKDLYLQGFNAVEIAKKINKNIEAVRKCIQRNFGNLKNQHLISRKIRRDEIRAVNKESKDYMSDKEFIKRNRSIYKTLPNGDIVLNKKVCGNVTWDTPKRLVNQYK